MRLPLTMLLGLIAYIMYKFARPAERIMESVADGVHSGSVILNATARVAAKVGDETVRVIDETQHGVRILDSGGDARSFQLGPLTRNETLEYYNSFYWDQFQRKALPEEMWEALAHAVKDAMHGKEASGSRSVNTYKQQSAYQGVAGKASVMRLEWAKKERFFLSASYKFLNVSLEWSWWAWNYLLKPPSVMDLQADRRVEAFVDHSLFRKLDEVFWHQHKVTANMLAGNEVDKGAPPSSSMQEQMQGLIRAMDRMEKEAVEQRTRVENAERIDRWRHEQRQERETTLQLSKEEEQRKQSLLILENQRKKEEESSDGGATLGAKEL